MDMFQFKDLEELLSAYLNDATKCEDTDNINKNNKCKSKQQCNEKHECDNKDCKNKKSKIDKDNTDNLNNYIDLIKESLSDFMTFVPDKNKNNVTNINFNIFYDGQSPEGNQCIVEYTMDNERHEIHLSFEVINNTIILKYCKEDNNIPNIPNIPDDVIDYVEEKIKKFLYKIIKVSNLSIACDWHTEEKKLNEKNETIFKIQKKIDSFFKEIQPYAKVAYKLSANEIKQNNIFENFSEKDFEAIRINGLQIKDVVDLEDEEILILLD